jgi:ELWxxDGT repeat protein
MNPKQRTPGLNVQLAAVLVLAAAGCHRSGTPAGTPALAAEAQALSTAALPSPTLLKDLLSTGTVTAASNPGNVTYLGSKMVFTATAAEYGNELWVSDGTTFGTQLLADINPGGADSLPTPLGVVNNKLVFNANDGAHGIEPWVTDGTTTVLLKDIYPGFVSSRVSNASTVFPGLILFFADDGVHGLELWKTDGTPSGTVLLKDTIAGSAPAVGEGGSGLTWTFALYNGKAWFGTSDGVNGVQLWSTDGTTAGTNEVAVLNPTGANPANFFVWNGLLYFAATDLQDPTGTELAVTDGTPAGTKYMEVNPTGASNPSKFFVFNSQLYFTSGQPGIPQLDLELWHYDGTNPPAKLKDINPLPTTDSTGGSSNPNNFTIVGTQLFFTATDGSCTTTSGTPPAPVCHGSELWVTDGTTAGTVMPADINPSPGAGSSPFNLNVVNGHLIFTATDGSCTTGTCHGNEWFTSDGTTAGTTVLLDINPTPGASSSPTVGGVATTAGVSTLYFSASDGTTGSAHGTELWKTDGTTAGTALVADINPGTASSSPSNWAIINGKVYFGATTATNGTEPWVSDGTTAGTVMISDINPGTASGSPATFENTNGNLMFQANNGTGQEWWFVPGFTGTPTFVDINPELLSTFTSTATDSTVALTGLGSQLFFVSSFNTTVGSELYTSDGTATGTGLFLDINPGTASSTPTNLTVMGSKLYFSASDGTCTTTSGTPPAPVCHGNELWSTDGTVTNTGIVKDINPTAGVSANISSLVAAGGTTLYFGANDGTHGTELWESNGTNGGTMLVKDINPGTATTSSNPSAEAPFGTGAFFSADDGVHGQEPWVTDGTTGGTNLLFALGTKASPASTASGAVQLDGKLFFVSSDGGATYGKELWITNGLTDGSGNQPAGTVVVDINPGTGDSSPTLLTVLRHKVVFVATTPSDGTELWVSDGTVAGTQLLKDIYPGIGSSNPTELTEVYGHVFFAATDPNVGRELWMTDGTPAGTVMVADINAGAGSSAPVKLARFGNVLLFGASDGLNGRELWQSDGTSAGTVLLGDLWPGSGSSEPGKATQVGTRAYLQMTSPVVGRELYYTSLPTTDLVAPNVWCPADVTQSASANSPGVVTFGAAGAYDDRPGAITITYSNASGSSFPIGTTVVTVTATDAALNAGTCTFNVTLTYKDVTPPVVSCPMDQTVVTHTLAGATDTFAATATDDVTANPTITYSQAPGTNFPVGSTTVTATAADAAGNTSSCSFAVTVTYVDNTPPVVTCPSDVAAVTHLNAPAVMTYTPATATDDSGGNVTLTYSVAPPAPQFPVVSGNPFPVGTTTVLVTGTDPTGNMATCSFNVTLTFVDTTAPLLTCPSDVAVISHTQAGTVVTYGPATATDPDSGGTPTVTYSKASGQLFPLGPTIVTTTAKDAAGNMSQCSFLVTVTYVDNTPPVVTCPSDVAVVTHLNAPTAMTYTPATATDDSGGNVTLTYSVAPPAQQFPVDSGKPFPVGTTAVLVTGTDASGNVATCSFNVTLTFVDTTAPLLTCPNDVAKSSPTPADIVVTYAPATATDPDSGGTPTVTYSKASGQSFPLGATTVTVTAQDAAGNMNQCSFNVTVTLDNTPPVVTCPSDVAAVTHLNAPAAVTYAPATATDDSGGIVTLAYSVAPPAQQFPVDSGQPFPIGTTSVLVTGADPAGNTATCSFNVTLTFVDTTAPLLTCPSDVSMISPTQAGIAVTYGTATATDPDSGGTPTVTYSKASGQVFPIGGTIVTTTARDAAGNTSQCSFLVSVNLDSTPPVLTCPNDVAVISPTQAGVVVTYGTATATDPDSGGTPTVTYSKASGQLFPIGPTIVTTTAKDAAGNTSQCSFLVTVTLDKTPPVLTCPSDVAVNSPTRAGIAVTYAPAMATDPDTGGTPTVTYSKASGQVFPIGPTIVTTTAQDAAGNTSQCSFLVTVSLVDTTPPVITCPAPVSATTTVAQGIVVSYDPAVATDNLTANPTVIYSRNSGELFPVGVTSVQAVATDDFGNTATCSFNVTVNLVDTTAPMITCPANQTATAHTALGVEVTFPDATATDNITAHPQVAYSPANGSLFAIGNTTVTASATDDAGNVGTCSFQVAVTLVDVTPPVITCPADQMATAANGKDAKVTWPDATATDNIDTTVPVTYSTENGSLVSIGTTKVTATAKDKAGNQSQCTFDVTVTRKSGCTSVDPASFFVLSGLIVLFKRRRRQSAGTEVL